MKASRSTRTGNIILMHHITAALLRARASIYRDVDYIVKRRQSWYDEHTGRTMQGRRVLTVCTGGRSERRR